MNRCRTLPERGRLVVLSGPSGSGKSTVIREILERRKDCVYSISSTTRPMRDYEVNGREYRFLTREEFFRNRQEDRFIEWSEVHGEFYGTVREEVENELTHGRHILFDIDVIGGERIRSCYPESILIFLYPPSVEELRRRLRLRECDDEKAIEKRLSRYPFEKAKGDKYPFRIVNDDLEQTIAQVLKIIDNESEPKGFIT